MKLASLALMVGFGLCQACSSDVSVSDGGAGGLAATSSTHGPTTTAVTSTSVTTSATTSSVTGTGGAGGGELPDIVVNGQVLQRDLDFAIVDAESDPCLIGEGCLNGPG